MQLSFPVHTTTKFGACKKNKLEHQTIKKNWHATQPPSNTSIPSQLQSLEESRGSGSSSPPKSHHTNPAREVSLLGMHMNDRIWAGAGIPPPANQSGVRLQRLDLPHPSNATTLAIGQRREAESRRQRERHVCREDRISSPAKHRQPQSLLLWLAGWLESPGVAVSARQTTDSPNLPTLSWE